MPTIREPMLWLTLRCLLAVLVSVHGWHRIMDDGILPFAHYMETRLPLGYYLVFILQAMELVGSLVFAYGRFVSILGLIFSIIYSCSIYFYHAQFGWFQRGGNQNGAEYAFLLVVCFLAIAIAAWPSRDENKKTPGLMRWYSGECVANASAANARSQFAWMLLGFGLVLIVAIHIASRIVEGNVDTLSSLIPMFISSPEVRRILALLCTALQGFACLAIVFGAYRQISFLTLAALFLLALLFHHLQFGWLVSGADKDGMEFTFLMMSLSLLLAMFYRPRIDVKNSNTII